MKNKYFDNNEKVQEYSNWKNKIKSNWGNIVVSQDENIDNTKLVAGSKIKGRPHPLTPPSMEGSGYNRQ